MLDMATITIGEKNYILSFNLQSMAKAEKLLGKPLQALFTSKEKGTLPPMLLSELDILFELGLKKEYPDLTSAQAQELLSDFLSQGESILIQTVLLQVLLGKALGFFRTEMNLQEEMTTAVSKVLKK